MSRAMADAKRWMIYGANGYTGQLVAELAKARGHAPILAGRSLEKVKPLADKLGFEARAFPLDAVKDGLREVSCVLHCAGPFSATSAPMVDACLESGASYLDVTGELRVIEAVLGRDDEAKAKGLSLLPAVGFDVVPSDCLALALKERLPGARSLELAFASEGRSSPGTMKTAIEALPEGGAIRRGGELVRVPSAHEVIEAPFHDRPRRCMAIPWGDLASAWVSTGIPDITVYMAAPSKLIRAARLSRFFAPALRIKALRELVQARIGATVRGPDEAVRATKKVELWGRVRDAGGGTVEGTLTVPEGYTFTAEAALESTLRVFRGEVRSGALTPAQAFGSRFVATLPGCTLRV